MASGKKCDRCGKFYGRNTIRSSTIVPDAASNRYIIGMYMFDNKGCLMHRMDLCDECHTKLRKFLEDQNEIQ